MRGKVLGAFRLDSELGSGGMGTVWLASVVGESPGLDRGRQVAVKIVHPHLLGHPEYAKRFLREAEIGRAIRHPNVVHTFEAGSRKVNGTSVSYLVMEYVAGRTLRRLLEDLGTVPEALLREIAAQVAAGLGAIHEAGIVHRDLKPENVLITEDQQIRIMDLGVARLVEQSVALTREGQFAGSLHYAAPEQFRGGHPTDRSDLYSLGVLLHELATGDNPFASGDAAQVIAAHLGDRPRPGPDLSPFFAELTATLLEREPDARFASADELAEVVAGGEESSWWEERERRRSRPEWHRPRVPVRRETSVYGRDTEIEELRNALDSARDGEGRFLLVEGEAGIGKSRLMDSFLASIETVPVTVIYGSYSPSGGVGGLSQAILDHVGTAGIEPYLDVVPELAASFNRLVRHESPDPGDEPIPKAALHTLFCHLLRGLAEKRPLVWVVEDLHFADPDSRAICLSLARAAAEVQVLLLATARPGLPERDLANFSALPHARRLSLDRLSPREIMQMLREAFRSASLADQLGGRIAWKTDGIPFFVMEMIHTLREGNYVREQPDGTFVATNVVSDLEVPSAVRDLIEARLRELDRADREVLDAGAVEGFEFDPGRVAAVLERRRIRVLQDLASLERRTGLVRGVGRRYRFDHHQIQEVLYQDLPDGLRAEYHTALAQTAPAATDPAAEDAVYLVHHHLRGSCPEEAGPYVLRVLLHLESASRNEAALDLASLAADVDGLFDGEDALEFALVRGRLLDLLGRPEEADSVLEEAGRLAGGSDDAAVRAKVERASGVHHVRMNRLDEAEVCFDRAIASAGESGDRKLLAVAMGNKGSVRAIRSDWEPALEMLGKSIAIAREAEHWSLVVSGLGNVGYIHLLCGRFAEAAECYEESLNRAEETKDRTGHAVALLRLGGLSQDLGRFEEARERFRASRSEFQAIGDRVNEAAAIGSLGNVWISLGRPQRAIDAYERCLHISREIGDPLGEGNALMNLGYPYLNLGDLDRAREIFTMCEQVAGQLDDPLLGLHAKKGLIAVREYAGEYEEAEREYRVSIERARELSYGLGLQGLVQSYGEFLLDRGRADEALEWFRESLHLAEENARDGEIVQARAGLAAIGQDDPAEVFRLFVEHQDLISVRDRMLMRILLSRATGDPEHLREARDIFETLREQAPDAYRDSIIENVPLHREILGLDD